MLTCFYNAKHIWVEQHLIDTSKHKQKTQTVSDGIKIHQSHRQSSYTLIMTDADVNLLFFVI